jgi:sugar phosphate isomerase/epimerase
MRTRTGQFRIGFRTGWSDWQKDRPALAAWGAQAGFELLDLGSETPDQVQAVRKSGLEVISVDLVDWSALLSVDPGKRQEAVARNAERIRAMAAIGVKVFFTVVIPEDVKKTPRENFKLAVESYGTLAEAAEQCGTMIVIEGWPGSYPYPNLCCNPETYRAMFQAVPSKGIGINFDPSHLIRLGIDHARFIDEFADRVGHVHGKDTEILTDNLYEIGLFHGSLNREPFFCGEFTWRYTIPGHGVTRWSHVFAALVRAGYRGGVCVEFEDASFNGTEAGEKQGLIASLQFLASA